MFDPVPDGHFEELKPDIRRSPGRIDSSMFKHQTHLGREDEVSKNNSLLSTKHKSEKSLRDEVIENYMPVIKRIEMEGDLGECRQHAQKRLKFYDISAPDNILCSKCVLDLVVDKNFNTAMTKEGSDLHKIQEKIGRDVEDLEKTHQCQTMFLSNLFSQLNVLINDVRIKYTSRVDKTFLSIKEIFTEKVNKLGKFEREMKELEKDVRLNYTNIIRLMDLDPFYEIIYRYNKKLNNIKSVFTEFKGKPDEIPEDAIRIKSLKSQLGFVSGLSKKIEHFFSENDSYDSNSISQELESERNLYLETPALDVVVQESITYIGEGRRPQAADKCIQTDSKCCPFMEVEFFKRKGAGQVPSSFKPDELKVQAELLIKSVDSLIAGHDSSLHSAIPHHKSKGECSSHSQRTSPENKHSKSITKAEIARRIQAHFNSSSVVGKVRSNSNTNSKSNSTLTNSNTSPLMLEKKQSDGAFHKNIDFDSIAKEISNRHKSKGSKDKSGPPKPAPIFMSNQQIQGQYAAPPKSRMSKQSSSQQSAGNMPSASSKDKEPRQDSKALSISKTERILQIYRKTKINSDN